MVLVSSFHYTSTASTSVYDPIKSSMSAIFGKRTTAVITEEFLASLPKDIEQCLTVYGVSGPTPRVQINKFLAHPVQLELERERVAIALPLVLEIGKNKIYYVELFYQKNCYEKDIYRLKDIASGYKFSNLSDFASRICSSLTHSNQDELLKNINKILNKEKISVTVKPLAALEVYPEAATLRLVTDEEIKQLEVKKANFSNPLKTEVSQENSYYYRPVTHLRIDTGESPYVSHQPTPVASMNTREVKTQLAPLNHA